MGGFVEHQRRSTVVIVDVPLYSFVFRKNNSVGIPLYLNTGPAGKNF